jgi:hypothetical protein
MPNPTMVWTPSGATNFEPVDMLFGHIPDPRFVAKEVDNVLKTMPSPIFYTAAQPIKDTGAGKIILLTKFLEQQLSGRFPIHTQTIGDCVSHGWGLGVDILSATQIQAGAAESFPGESATEIVYAGSRVEIGKGKCGSEDGSVGAWAAQFVTEYGTLIRNKYGKLDLTVYDGQTAKKLGAPRAGVPDPLEPLCREHPIKTTSLVRSYKEARDAIANGYPVPVCSTVGFESPSASRIQRDQDGFGRRAGSWPHCMLFCGVDDAFKRPGLLCVNSWGIRWITGPRRHDQPEGSFWVDADVVDIMLREGDSFAISGYLGYPAQPGLEYMLI